MPTRSRDAWSTADWRHWRTLRAFILERDGHACRFCKNATNVVGRLDVTGDAFHPDNLAAQCRRCLGSRALEAQPKRAYPGPSEISRPNDPASPRQAKLIRRLGGDADGLTRASATALIAELLEAEKVAS